MSSKPAHLPTRLPANTTFGWFFAGLFTVVAMYVSWRHPEWLDVALGLLAAALAFALTTLVYPKALTPLNRAWFAFGLLLGRVVSPLVLGVIFFGLLTPVGLVMRLFGRDALRLRLNKSKSYWVEREPVAADSFKNQF